jgi:hypothetical protein
MASIPEPSAPTDYLGTWPKVETQPNFQNSNLLSKSAELAWKKLVGDSRAWPWKG